MIEGTWANCLTSDLHEASSVFSLSISESFFSSLISMYFSWLLWRNLVLFHHSLPSIITGLLWIVQYVDGELTCRSHPMDSKNKLSSLSTAMFSHENTTHFYWTLLQWKDKANNFLPCLLIKPWVLSKNSFRLDHFVFFKNEKLNKMKVLLASMHY